jgi:phosphate-selective porin
LAATCAAIFVATTHAAAAPAVKATAKAAGPASLTGCLQNDDGHFKLTDLPDGQAPKARNWKTAYVTKSSKDIEVVGAANLKLKDHVGHKVTVVGTRDSATRVKATSLKMVASRCS